MTPDPVRAALRHPSSWILALARVAPLGRVMAALWYRMAGPPALGHWVFRALVARSGAAITARYPLEGGLRLSCDPFSYLGTCLRQDAQYEPITTRVWLRLATPDATVFDVGANVGYFTLLASHQLSTGSVHAFEPHPVNFRHLRSNLQQNRCVAAVNSLALGRQPGTARLHLGGIPDTHSLGRTSQSSDETIDVAVSTIDEYCERQHISRIDVIKIDVEGAERDVVLGGVNSLKRSQPVLIVEVGRHSLSFGYTANELLQTFSQIGYIAFTLLEWPLRRMSPTADVGALANVLLAVPSDVANGLIRGRVPVCE